jgi:hypothetical protein
MAAIGLRHVCRNNSNTTVIVPGAAGGTLQTVDESSGNGPAWPMVLSNDTIDMAPFAVSVLTFAS